MTNLWRVLSGDIPGGFALLLTALAAFLIIWEFVYRIGETLPAKTYRKWRFLGLLIILVVYALLWVQSPPKVEPQRIAILPGDASRTSWQNRAAADIATRSLRNTVKNLILNPWDGAADYATPIFEVAERAGYRVFMVNAASPAIEDVWPSALATVQVILKTLGEKPELKDPFSQKPPNSAIEFYFQGLLILERGKSDSAKNWFEDAVKTDSAFIPARIGLAHCWEFAGDFVSAQNCLMEASRRDSESTEALLALGEFFLRRYEWNGAESALKVVLARDPLNVRAMVGLSRIHPERLKDLRFTSAEALAEEAVRLDPAYEQARLILVDQIIPKGYLVRARNLLNGGLEFNPRSQNLGLKLGSVEIRSGHPEKAREIYEEMLKWNPLDAVVEFNLGAIQYHTKQYDQALTTFHKIQAQNGPVDCLYYLGMIYKFKGDTERAREYFQQRWDKRTSDDDEFGILAGRQVAEMNKRESVGR